MLPADFQIEPERYELEGKYEALDRRTFFKTLGLGLVVVGLLHGQRRRSGAERPKDLAAWLHIGENGSITAFTGKVEVGQNTRTALIQGIAEELRVPVASITLQMGDTSVVPYDMGTFGSRSMPDMLPQVRHVAASAREILAAVAARKLGADVKQVSIFNGVVSTSGKSLNYGDIVQGEQLFKTAMVTDEAPLTPPDQWKILGTAVPKFSGRDIVTGRHKYTSDVNVTGMTAGKVPRDPSSAVKPATATDQNVYSLLRDTGGSRESSITADAERKLKATYHVAYIAHCPLEPRAAVAQWNADGTLTVWTGTQVPFGVRSELASTFNLPETSVRVIVPDTGSAYGGKHTGECAVEAARLAKAAGKPVKLIWTREEEFTWAYFRPAGVIDVESGFTPDGKLTHWEFHNYNSGNSALQTLYEVPQKREQFHRSDSPLRQGSYRGLAATANHFARESFMDEIAHTVGKDPIAFRLQNLKDARLRTVLQAAAEKFGWSRQNSGIACGFDKGGYVATAAQISTDPELKNLKVERVVVAFECGSIVNPDLLRNQVEGAVIQGLGGALFERVKFGNGQILNPRLSQYRVPRFMDIPVIETVLIDRRDLPAAGAGECPIIGIAPAIGNAIFASTGKRVRSMPLT